MTTSVRRPGRPRDARADEAILDAAADVLAECGVTGFSVDAVAARAGVGKATIYRRWPSRSQLLLETAHLAVLELSDPDTGSVRDDLVALLSALAVKMRDTPAGRMLPAVAAEAAVNPEMQETLARFSRERRQLAVLAVTRGIERGEVLPGTDPDLVVDMLAGPVFLRHLLTRMPVDEALVERAVDALLGGIATTTS